MDSTILSSIIGICGIIFGILLSEFIRRRSKIERFSETYFNKKIEVYDKLFEDFLQLTNLFSELLETESTIEEKLEIWHESVLDFLSYLDKKGLFFSEELTVHLSLTLISAGEFIEKDDSTNEVNIRTEFKDAKLLIKKSLGLHKIEKDFIKTSQSKLKSEYINYYNSIKDKFNAK